MSERKWTEEQREGLRQYKRDWYASRTPEQLEEIRDRDRNRIANMTAEQREARRAYQRQYSALNHYNVHKPDGNMPRDLTLRCRLQCLDMGLDPGVPADIRLAILEISYQSPELQRSWFHPDYLVKLSNVMAQSWRRCPKAQSKARALHESNQVE